MIKIILFTPMIAVIGWHCAVAQKAATVSPATFKQLIGCWHGTLHYSGTVIRKPYTTTAELNVKQIDSSGKFELLHIYTQDSARTSDTITISADGSKLNSETITSNRSTPEGNLEIITTSSGFDHDNNKAATIRQTYTISKEHYTYKKEVQLEGQSDWLERQDFSYTRKICSSKN